MKVKSAGLLAAGIANRMNEGYFPKSLIPVGNLSPILYHLFNLRKIGINNVVIVINKKSSILKEYLGNGNQFSMKIDYIEDDEKLDTGGDLKQILSKINEDFLLISCDTIIEVDYSILIDKFKQDSFLFFYLKKNQMENIILAKIINYIIHQILQMKMREFHLLELGSFKENP